MPMIIMEPVKGGTLANMSEDLEAIFKEARPDDSVASWALRFVGSLDGVTTILSGMSNMEQVEDNLKTFVDFEPISESEQKVIDTVVKKMIDTPLIPCTSCKYCCDGCPAKIQIPSVFNAVNTLRKFPGDMRPIFFYNNLTAQAGSRLPGTGKASDCYKCGQCEGVCPQHLPIIELLEEAAEKLEIGQ